MASEKNRYVQIIEQIFLKHYRKGSSEVPFARTDIIETAAALGISLPKNLGDIIYSFRYRTALPSAITKKAKQGYAWIIRPSGRGRYTFVLTKEASFAPSPMLAKTKIPDATPGIVSKYSFDDEQALLAKIRYNRLIDIFTGVTCYSLQNHLRTTLTDIGQVKQSGLSFWSRAASPSQPKPFKSKRMLFAVSNNFEKKCEKHTTRSVYSRPQLSYDVVLQAV